MRRHNTLALAAAALCAVALAACGSSPSSSTSTASASTSASAPASSSASASAAPSLSANPTLVAELPAAIKASGTLTVATDASYPPFEFYASNNKTIIGADAQLATAIAQLLGLKVDLINTPFDGIVAGIAADKWDVSLSGIADTSARQQQVNFVDYSSNGDAFLVLSADASKYPSWTSLCGQTVAIESGTTMVSDAQTASGTCTKAGKGAIKVDSYQTQSAGVLALTSNRAAVLISTGGSAGYIAEQSNGQFAVVNPSDPLRARAFLGVAVPKSDPGLDKPLQGALSELLSDGIYTSIMTQWGLNTCCTVSKITINDATS